MEWMELSNTGTILMGVGAGVAFLALVYFMSQNME